MEANCKHQQNNQRLNQQVIQQRESKMSEERNQLKQPIIAEQQKQSKDDSFQTAQNAPYSFLNINLLAEFHKCAKTNCDQFFKKHQAFMEPYQNSFNNYRVNYPVPMEAQQQDSNQDSQSQSYQSHQNGTSTGEQAYSRIKHQYHPPHPQVLNYTPPPQQNYQIPVQNYQNPPQQYANYNKRPSNNDDEDDFETNNQPVLMGRRRMTNGQKKNARGKRSQQYESILNELKSKRRLKRKFRHKDRPKKAKSAYNLFVQDVVPRIKAQNPTFGAPDLVRVAAQMYNQLNQQQKRPYQQRYLIDKKRFDRQREVFFQNHPEMDYRFDAKKMKQPYTPSKSQSSYGGQRSGNGYYDNRYSGSGYVDSD